jgi:hypothetical protein
MNQDIDHIICLEYEKLTNQFDISSYSTMLDSFDQLLYDVGSKFEQEHEVQTYDKFIHTYFSVILIDEQSETIDYSQTEFLVLMNILEYYFSFKTVYCILMYQPDIYFRTNYMMINRNKNRNIIELIDEQIKFERMVYETCLKYRIGPKQEDKTVSEMLRYMNKKLQTLIKLKNSLKQDH